ALIKETFTKGVSYVFPGKCFDELLIKYHFDNSACTSLVISRLLGLAITAGSCMLFFPQIAKIHAAKSAQGLSLCAQLLGLLGAASTAAYSYSKGFVFGQWGDSFFVTLQVIVMVMQILYYSPNKAYTFPFFSLCWAGFFAVQGGYIPMQVLMWLQAAGIPIVVVSKGLQIWECHSARSTGVLSIISVVMQLGGTIARVFTSVKETGDPLLIGGFAVAALLNAVIFAQFFVYGPSKKDEKKKKQ
ncbi:hypothetical protein PENTCL1PPCAC_27188, partial [Pristionchus entomophagus]